MPSVETDLDPGKRPSLGQPTMPRVLRRGIGRISSAGSQIVNVAPPSGLLRTGQPARLFLEELGGQIQPVAGPVVPGREEWLEDAIDVRLGDARAIVHDVHDDPLPSLLLRPCRPARTIRPPGSSRARACWALPSRLNNTCISRPGSTRTVGTVVVAVDFDLDLAIRRRQPLQEQLDRLSEQRRQARCPEMSDELLRTVATRWSSRS